MLEFFGKGNRFSSLTGEKLSEHQVTQSMEATVKQMTASVGAYALAPIWGEPPYYGLFVEQGDLAERGACLEFLAALDRELGRQNSEYGGEARKWAFGADSAQVLPVGTWLAWDRERLGIAGGSPEQYKHPCLIGDIAFHMTMNVLHEIDRGERRASAP